MCIGKLCYFVVFVNYSIDASKSQVGDAWVAAPINKKKKQQKNLGNMI